MSTDQALADYEVELRAFRQYVDTLGLRSDQRDELKRRASAIVAATMRAYSETLRAAGFELEETVAT